MMFTSSQSSLPAFEGLGRTTHQPGPLSIVSKPMLAMLRSWSTLPVSEMRRAATKPYCSVPMQPYQAFSPNSRQEPELASST